MGFNDSLQAARRRERFTYRELDALTDIRYPRIHAIFNGDGAPPTRTEKRLLAAVLRIPLSNVRRKHSAKAARRAYPRMCGHS